MMREVLVDYLRSCCVRVLGEKSGCGFFIAPQLIVTCSHVVGRDVEKASEVSLKRWSNSTDDLTLFGTVVANFPQEDIAFITTSEPNQSFAALGKEISRGHSLTAVGFPEYDGQIAFDQFEVQYEGQTMFIGADGKERIDTKLKSGQIKPGYSGGPLLNLETSRVVGVVALSRDVYMDLGGWAVDTSVVERLACESHQTLPSIDPGWVKAASKFTEEKPQERRDSYQERLLMSVETEITEGLAQSFPNDVRIPYVIKRQDSLVQKPWSTSDTQNDYQKEEVLEDRDTILQVFDSPELSRQLLILGEPGTGKTVILLELASGLLKRARVDETQPIPVIINLASWTEDQSIFDWLLQELKEKYSASRELAIKWIEQSQLSFLLDGFDEVEPKAYASCAFALNDWLLGPLEQRPCSVVICSRKEEFCNLEQPPINLYGAAYLQTLSDQKIVNYLTTLQLEDVWKDVQDDEDLHDLLNKPLFLSLFGLAQSSAKFSLRNWKRLPNSDARVSYLLDMYLEAVFSQDLVIDPQSKRRGMLSKTYGKSSLPTSESTMRTLVFTAKGLEEESRTDFLIEKIQPSWLQSTQERRIYGELLFILIMLPFLSLQITAQLFSLELSLLLFTFPWLKLWLTRDFIIPADKLRFLKLIEIASEHRPGISLVLSLISTSLVCLSWLIERTGEEWRPLIVVPISGVMINMSLSWLIENMKEDIVVTTEPNQGIKNLWSNMLRFTLLLIPIAALLTLRFNVGINAIADKSLSTKVIASYAIYIIGFAFFESGGKALAQHTVLRLICYLKRYAPLRYGKMLDYCTERHILQRLGGRYRFVHRLLQKHFADMSLP